MGSKLVKRPLIGVAVIVIKDDKVLLGRRMGSHGAGTWAFPGGHLEFGESIEACAEREVFEETGLSIKRCRFGSLTNDIFTREKKHYVTLFILADYDSGELELKEPDRCDQWDWFSWNRLPEPRFLSLENVLAQGFDPDLQNN